MNEIAQREGVLERLKSPVVIGAVIVAAFNLAGTVTGVDYSDLAAKIVAVVTSVVTVFAALNDAKSKTKF